MKRLVLLSVCCALCFSLLPTWAHPKEDPKEGWDMPKKTTPVDTITQDDGKPVVQIALLLDTSGSMNGLIDQAKAELWSIVNSMGEARYKGQVPKIEVGLFEYGKSTISSQVGYIRKLSPLTTDLDGISESLFSLETNGGSEYCAWVIKDALNTLAWKRRKGSLRLIFIAGNESFYQGPVSYDEALSRADDMGVLVHPIYCNNGNSNDLVTWKQAAQTAHTQLKVINHDRVAVDPKTPYDDQIRQLGQKLNSTYVAYGPKGEARAARQRKQDSNSVTAGAGVNRSVTKASSSYRNAEWDLVDAEKEGADVGAMSEEQLPQEMKEMSPEARRDYVEQKSQERQQIQQEIQQLEDKRRAYIAKNRSKDSPKEASLGEAVIDALRAKAKAEGFTIE